MENLTSWDTYEQWIIDFSRVFTFSGACELPIRDGHKLCSIPGGMMNEGEGRYKWERSITYAALLFAAQDTQLRFS